MFTHTSACATAGRHVPTRSFTAVSSTSATSKRCGSAGGFCTSSLPGKKENFSRQPSSFHIVTSLPSCCRHRPIASVQPSASPSGRTCDITTKRFRVRINSAIEASEAFSVMAFFLPVLPVFVLFLRLRQPELVQDVQHAVSALPGRIQLEMQLGRKLHHHALAHLFLEP